MKLSALGFPFYAAMMFGFLLAATSRAENWPQFRGPTGMGITTEKELPVEWGGKDNKNVLWSAPLVGEGHASPIVWGDRLFVTTAHWADDVKDRTKVIPEHHVLCYRTTDGKLLWDRQIEPGSWLRNDFRSGPGGGYACPTPATDGKLVFVAFGSSVLAALDFDGRVVWRQAIEPHTFDVTLGSSPILFGDTVILLHAMARKEDSRVVAYDKATGEPKWDTPLPKNGFGHSTPVLIDVAGKPQMLVLASSAGQTGEALHALDPATGKILWWCKGGGDAASPAYGQGLVYFDSGRGGPGVAVDPSGQGDVSASHVRWTIGQVPEGIGSPLVVGDHIYRLHNPGVLKCWDLATGKEVYAKRLSGLSTTWASPLADPAGRIYFANAGKSYVLQSGPEYKVLAENDLGDSNHASAAASGGRLYLVGMKKVYCVGKE